MKKQKITIGLTIITLLATVLFTAPAAFAQSGAKTSHSNFFDGLIAFISQKFGLDKTQVQTAVNDYKTQNKLTPRPTLTPDQIQAKEKERLDKLVSAGKITSDQENLILTENSLLRTKYDPANLKSLTADQRKQKFQDEQAEIKTWAGANNIDPKYLMPRLGFGRMGEMHERFGEWNKPTPTPSP